MRKLALFNTIPKYMSILLSSKSYLFISHSRLEYDNIFNEAYKLIYSIKIVTQYV